MIFNFFSFASSFSIHDVHLYGTLNRNCIAPVFLDTFLDDSCIRQIHIWAGYNLHCECIWKIVFLIY